MLCYCWNVTNSGGTCAFLLLPWIGKILPGRRHNLLRLPLGQVCCSFCRFMHFVSEWPLRAFCESIELPLRLPCGESAHSFEHQRCPQSNQRALLR